MFIVAENASEIDGWKNRLSAYVAHPGPVCPVKVIVSVAGRLPVFSNTTPSVVGRTQVSPGAPFVSEMDNEAAEVL
jgi:hypothetical protein